jgi:hypothetical protein
MDTSRRDILLASLLATLPAMVVSETYGHLREVPFISEGPHRSFGRDVNRISMMLNSERSQPWSLTTISRKSRA